MRTSQFRRMRWTSTSQFYRRWRSKASHLKLRSICKWRKSKSWFKKSDRRAGDGSVVLSSSLRKRKHKYNGSWAITLVSKSKLWLDRLNIFILHLHLGWKSFRLRLLAIRTNRKARLSTLTIRESGWSCST